MRAGLPVFPWRTVRRGSSFSSVARPTPTAACFLRRSWTNALDCTDVIQRESPAASAILASSVRASLTLTHGRRCVTQKKKSSLSRCASCSSNPVQTSAPASASRVMPFPLTSGLGSRTDATTLRMPASMIAVVQGAVLPKWQQGSSVTYIVAPRALLPACARAFRSAWGPPYGEVAPFPTTVPFLTTTAPTAGLGNVFALCLIGKRQGQLHEPDVGVAHPTGVFLIVH